MTENLYQEKDVESAVAKLKNLFDGNVLPASTLEPINVIDPSSPSRLDVWRALHELNLKSYRLYSEVARPFHVLALWLLKGLIKEQIAETQNGGEPEHERLFKVRLLLQWLQALVQRKRFWGDWNDGIAAFNGNREDTVVAIWKVVAADKGLVTKLEENDQLVSRDVAWLLSQLALTHAFKVRRSDSNWFLAALQMLVSSPIFAGVCVGWLFVLQGESVVEFVYGASQSWLTLIGIFLVPLVISGLYAYGASLRNGAKSPRLRAFWMTISALFVSLTVGFVFMCLAGDHWFQGMMPAPDCKGGWLQHISALSWPWRAYIFGLLYAPVAVFIGIFAQLIWTGRGPMEPVDSPNS